MTIGIAISVVIVSIYLVYVYTASKRNFRELNLYVKEAEVAGLIQEVSYPASWKKVIMTRSISFKLSSMINVSFLVITDAEYEFLYITIPDVALNSFEIAPSLSEFDDNKKSCTIKDYEMLKRRGFDLVYGKYGPEYVALLGSSEFQTISQIIENLSKVNNIKVENNVLSLSFMGSAGSQAQLFFSQEDFNSLIKCTRNLKIKKTLPK